ncbi:MAG TPA: hypothetical protein VMZ66_04160 [Aeromicrobium sp.]|nr:hypothetical protein [Aeromicrobium sp.]
MNSTPAAWEAELDGEGAGVGVDPDVGEGATEAEVVDVGEVVGDGCPDTSGDAAANGVHATATKATIVIRTLIDVGTFGWGAEWRKRFDTDH